MTHAQRFTRILKATTDYLREVEKLNKHPNDKNANRVKVLHYQLQGLVCKENKVEGKEMDLK